MSEDNLRPGMLFEDVVAVDTCDYDGDGIKEIMAICRYKVPRASRKSDDKAEAGKTDAPAVREDGLEARIYRFTEVGEESAEDGEMFAQDENTFAEEGDTEPDEEAGEGSTEEFSEEPDEVSDEESDGEPVAKRKLELDICGRCRSPALHSILRPGRTEVPSRAGRKLMQLKLKQLPAWDMTDLP